MKQSAARHFLLTAGFLAAASLCYLAGFTLGFGLLLLLGASFELVFWYRVLSRQHKRQQRLKALHEA